MAEWGYAGAAMFWLLMLVFYSRKWKHEKTELQNEIRNLQARRMHEQAARNVSDARLSMIQQVAEQALKGRGSPYRTAGVSALDVLEKVVDLVDTGMRENFREVGHFNTLGEARMFLDTLPSESNAYVFPMRMWDGDCYHVVYSVPEPTEMPPEGQTRLG